MMQVRILATCLDPSRLDVATLVFKTLRVGFPSASVVVFSNGNSRAAFDELSRHANAIGGDCFNIPPMPHGEWIERLIADGKSPTWIVDSDTVFFDRVEHWFSGSSALFAGRYEPEFLEPWTKSIHVARLHPSMMWINPVPLRAAIRGWPGKSEFLDSVQKQLIRWHWVPEVRTEGGRRLKFYDTMAGLWHAVEGSIAFVAEQNAAYAHLFCGSYAHLIPGMEDLQAVQRAAVADPQSARGLWAAQQEWYGRNKV